MDVTSHRVPVTYHHGTAVIASCITVAKERKSGGHRTVLHYNFSYGFLPTRPETNNSGEKF